MTDDRSEPVTFPVGSVGDVLRCFDATATDAYAWICRLVDGDVDQAGAVLANVYVAARRAGERTETRGVVVASEAGRRFGNRGGAAQVEALPPSSIELLDADRAVVASLPN